MTTRPRDAMYLHVMATMALLCALPVSQVRAQISNQSDYTPGPNGGARISSLAYLIFARDAATNSIIFREIDPARVDGFGLESTPWIGPVFPTITTFNYPAAATLYNSTGTPIAVSVFLRGTDNRIHVFKVTKQGSQYLFTTCTPLPFTTDAAPGAAGYRMEDGVFRVVLFWRDITSQTLRMSSSTDGFTGWTTPLALPTAAMTSAPSATVDARPPVGFFKDLKVFYRTSGNVMHYALNTGATLAASGWMVLPGGDAFTRELMASPANRSDPAIVSAVGAAIPHEDPTQWSAYYVPEMQVMRANIMKFQLDYDDQWKNGPPAKYTCRWREIDAAIREGASVIILRTSETHIAPSEIDHFMGRMLFPDNTVPILTLAADNRSVRWIIEVGNEPDNAGVSASSQRDKALQTGVTIPRRSLYYQFHWIVSMPTAARGIAYLDEFTAFSNSADPTIQGKRVMDLYGGVGVHIYDPASFSWYGPGNPLGVLHYTLAYLPYSKNIFVTEAGIAGTLAWNAKGSNFLNAIYAAPASVRGWTYFVMDAHPMWNTGTRYSLDQNYTDRKITAITAAGANTKITYAGDSNYIGPGALIAIHESGVKNPTDNLDGEHRVLRSPAPGPNFYYVEKNITGMSAYNASTSPGRTDRYPLTPVNGRPCAQVLGSR